ncbi:MAG: 6-phosphofructokinase [Bacteroidales bacterium]|nr:6-phosphofructokinase [Bacteroidales bacterium]
MTEIKKIGVLTSGGDAPGMNAAIRAVVRTAIYHGLEVVGIMEGYSGLINNDFIEMHSHSVSNIIQRGGTILRTARCEEFKTKEGMKKAYQNLINANINALIVIGGDGTFRGAHTLYKRYNFPVIGLPGTIDNDLFGTDYTIGYDTALNTVIQAVDKIRDTADSHNRLFFVEVMGRDAGFIALNSGIACGAEAILIPETKTHVHDLINILDYEWRENKKSLIIIVAEGDDAGGAYSIAKKVKQEYSKYDTRVTVLGHIQRGGSPSCTDRVLASTLGFEAVKAAISGKTDIMIGEINKKIVFTPFENASKYNLKINKNMLDMARVLSL